MADSPPFEVVTFGETMLRLSPPGRGRLEEATSLEVRVGGSESNTAIALARLGRKVAWWSALPENGLGRRIAFEIRRWGVDITLSEWRSEGRVGLYFVEFGVPPRAHAVTYDRAASVIAELELGDAALRAKLAGARHLHVSGITPALSPGCRSLTERACRLARESGMTTSIDVNFRARLWTAEEARAALEPICALCSLAICAQPDAETVFGARGEPLAVAEALRCRFGAEAVAVTAGMDGVYASSAEGSFGVPVVACLREVDRVGSGDAFSAGMIHGYLDGDLEKGLRFGAVMSTLKHTMKGDILVATKEEIEAQVAGAGAAIQR